MDKIEFTKQVAEMNCAFRKYCESDGAETVATNTDAYFMWLNAWAAARDFYLNQSNN